MLSTDRRIWKCADIGGGGGADLFLIRSAVPDGKEAEFTGVDANPKGLQVLQLRKEYFGADDVKVVNSDITKELPFADGELDFIFCSEVVEHLEHPQDLLREIHRTLKPKRRDQMREEVVAAALVMGDVTLYGHISLKPYREWRNEPCGDWQDLCQSRNGPKAAGGL